MQTVVTKTIRNFFNDDRPLADENSPGQSGRLAIVGEKVMALAEAELDKKLRDLDVDPGRNLQGHNPEETSAVA